MHGKSKLWYLLTQSWRVNYEEENHNIKSHGSFFGEGDEVIGVPSNPLS